MAGDPYVCPKSPVTGCLNPEGIAQAENLRLALQVERVDAAFSSPYGRALQTAEIALAGRHVTVQRVPGLEEWKPEPALRAATSTVYEDMQKRDIARYAEETWKTEQGEGTFDMYARVVPAFLQAMADFGWHHRLGGWTTDDGKEDCGVAIFAHGGSLNILLAFILGVMPFPIGRFSFELTGIAKIDFVERQGIRYPALVLPAWHAHAYS